MPALGKALGQHRAWMDDGKKDDAVEPQRAPLRSLERGSFHLPSRRLVNYQCRPGYGEINRNCSGLSCCVPPASMDVRCHCGSGKNFSVPWNWAWVFPTFHTQTHTSHQ